MSTSPQRTICAGGYTLQPQSSKQRRVIPYIPQYIEPSRAHKKVYVPSWLQAREPVHCRTLGVELPSVNYQTQTQAQARNFSTPHMQYTQGLISEAATDTEEEEELQNISYEDTETETEAETQHPGYYYRTSHRESVAQPQAAYPPGVYAVPIGNLNIFLASEEEEWEEGDEEEEEEEWEEGEEEGEEEREGEEEEEEDREEDGEEEEEQEDAWPTCHRTQPSTRLAVTDLYIPHRRLRTRDYPVY